VPARKDFQEQNPLRLSQYKYQRKVVCPSIESCTTR